MRCLRPGAALAPGTRQLALSLLIAGAAAAQDFHGLGFLEDPGSVPAASSYAYDIAANGTEIVGKAYRASGGAGGDGSFAVRWPGPAATTPIALNGILGGRTQVGSVAWAASVIGRYAGEMGVWDPPEEHGVRWSGYGGAISSQGFLDTRTVAHAYGTSPFGSVVVGKAQDDTYRFRAVRAAGGGFTSLGTLFGDPEGEDGVAWASDHDGDTVVGEVTVVAGGSIHAFWWTPSGGMTAVPFDEPSTQSIASAVTPDGTRIVGTVAGDGGTWGAFVYDRLTATHHDLGSYAGGVGVYVYDTDEDATVLVGRTTGYPTTALIWRTGKGWESLAFVLAYELGLLEEVSGWQLLEAHGVSDDGRVIVGNGIDPQGKHEAWVAVLGGNVLVFADGFESGSVGAWSGPLEPRR